LNPAPSFFFKVLTDSGKRVLRTLATPVTERDFYLAGGTALALQLGHRRSVDFDWFREESIPDPLAFATELRGAAAGLVVLGTSTNTLHGELDGVRASWFTYPYPLLESPVELAEFPCRLASIADIAAMKLTAVAQRGAKKDFYDLFAIARSGLDLAGMLAAYKKKFDVQDIGHVLVALTWFEDAEADPAPILDSADDWEAVKAGIRSWVRDLAG